MKYVKVAVAVAVLLAGLTAIVVLRPITPDQPARNSQSGAATPETIIDDQPTTALLTGRYELYDASKLVADGYTETILFFHAPWCPECRAFEKEITSSTVPDGVQILKVDYDSSDELKSKYGVTLQSTFVKVAGNGDLISKWQGYGKDKSVTAILENT